MYVVPDRVMIITHNYLGKPIKNLLFGRDVSIADYPSSSNPLLFLLVCAAKGVDIQEEFIMHFEYLGGDFAANINST